MKPYTSKSGKPSGVTAYTIGADFIIVWFGQKDSYKYSYDSAGADAVEEMKELAIASKGLSSYISRNQPEFE